MTEQEKVQYQCVSCGKTAEAPGECCGQPMAQIGSPSKEGGESQ